ncbi:MAG: hypothetical protein ABIE23_04165 [archaeon]|nr:hypothetical protein [Candidatus Micrarchaeota archaeon]
MNGIRGQGTTEYLIILAVIIVIALVVVGIMGWVPGLGGGISEQQSKTYWQGTAPWAIVDHKIGDGDQTLVLQNMTTDRMELKNVSLGGTDLTFTDVNVAGGGTTTIGPTSDSITCASNSRFSFDVIITYDTVNIAGKTQVGDKALIGTCT